MLLFVYLFVLLFVFVEQTIEIMGQSWTIHVREGKVGSVCVDVCAMFMALKRQRHQPSPKSPIPLDKQKKYNRQLRLWGDHGQSALERAR